MGKIVAVENISLDGVMQAPGRPDEDTRNGFDKGGWMMAAQAEDPGAMEASMGAAVGPPAAMLFGRFTYEDLVGYWLSTDQPNPFTEILRNTEKYVATRTRPDPLPFPNSTALRGDDVIEQVAAIRDRHDGEIIVLGSGDLVRQLAAAGLVDSYILTVIPVVLGSGTKLFADTYTRFAPARPYAGRTGIVVHRLDVMRDGA